MTLVAWCECGLLAVLVLAAAACWLIPVPHRVHHGMLSLPL
jgi:hypothetical protein